MPTFDFPLIANPLLAVMDAMIWLPCLITGFATGTGVFWLLTTLRTEDLQQYDEWRYDVTRINALRNSDVIYRLF